jgi:hypothetical protein
MAFCLWLVIVAARHEAGFFQASQPVGQDVRGDAFLGSRQQFPKMATIAEHEIADDDEAPAIPQRFQRQIDRAPQPIANCDCRVGGPAR